MSDFLKEFFAVTSTSLYRVFVEEKNGVKQPVMTKLVMRGNVVSKRPVGEVVEGYGGPVIRIWADCLQMCSDWLDENHHADYTSHIVALFLNEEEAHLCLGFPGAQKLDPHWRKQTRQVLKLIGDDNSVFIIMWHSFHVEFLTEEQ